MLNKTPTDNELLELLGDIRFGLWKDICAFVESLYDVPAEWGSGGKKWAFEYKYRRGGKTLCALYAKKNCLGFMIILGAKERDSFESQREKFGSKVVTLYDEAVTYHDGKWFMLEIENQSYFSDIIRLLSIKRKPNKTVLSCCGVVCSKCDYYPNDCLGCPKIQGKPFWLQYTGESVCSIYHCCVEQKKQANCGACPNLPCSFYEKGDPTKGDEENKAILKKQLSQLNAMQKIN